MGAQAPYDDPPTLKGDEEVAALSIEESTQPDWTPEEERRVKRKYVVNLSETKSSTASSPLLVQK
jgi:hypothetical protein